MPNIRWLIALITAFHRLSYRATNGRFGARYRGMRFLLLTHVGRRTGWERVTPLLYLEDGGRWVVVASNAGDDRNPGWYLNLKSRPEARIQVGGRRFAVKARGATAEERDRLWPRVVAAYRHYERYRRSAARPIPVVVLEPEATQ